MELGEKKVEYIELIYDLIFVYFLGRNNEILHNIEGSFFTFETYLTFFLGMLVILQIWYFSILFINRYGDNSLQNTIGLFINMYLIFYMANGTSVDWKNSYLQYNIAWGLILINIAVQYYLQLRKSKKESPWLIPYIKRHLFLLLIQAAIIFASIPLYNVTSIPLSWISLAAGFIFILLTRIIDSILPVNFEHLTERVMLFVVFTFGEMIISIAVYFEGAFTFSTVYFSLMTLLIVAGLFLSYGFLYNHIIDRQMTTNGVGYMMLHVVLLIALCNITAALPFMKEPEIDTASKVILLVTSLLIYFAFLLLIGGFSKKEEKLCRKNLILLILTAVVFVILMIIFYNNAYISVAASVLFIFTEHLLLVSNHRKVCKTANEN